MILFQIKETAHINSGHVLLSFGWHVMMALTQENVHYTLNSGQVEWGSCADPGIFFRRWVGGGVEARRPENSLDNVFFSHQLILQFTEWIQWFYCRGEEGVQLLPGGVGVHRNPYNLLFSRWGGVRTP